MASFEVYDYIIIGSGPAGCAVARSLLENINQKRPNGDKQTIVLLEEAKENPAPAICQVSSGSPSCVIDYRCYQSTNPSEHVFENCCFAGRGRALGGGSAINAGYYVDDPSYWSEIWPSRTTEENKLILTTFWNDSDMARVSNIVRGYLNLPLPYPLTCSSQNTSSLHENITVLGSNDISSSQAKSVPISSTGNTVKTDQSVGHVKEVGGMLKMFLHACSTEGYMIGPKHRPDDSCLIVPSDQVLKFKDDLLHPLCSVPSSQTMTCDETFSDIQTIDDGSDAIVGKNGKYCGLTLSTMHSGVRISAAKLLCKDSVEKTGIQSQGGGGGGGKSGGEGDEQDLHSTSREWKHKKVEIVEGKHAEIKYRGDSLVGRVLWAPSDNLSNHDITEGWEDIGTKEEEEEDDIHSDHEHELIDVFKDHKKILKSKKKKDTRKTAAGVELQDGTVIRARKCVIIGAGPEPSVRILLNSGISQSESELGSGLDSKALHEVSSDKSSEGEGCSLLHVPLLGSFVYDHPTVFEPIFYPISCMEKDRPIYQAAAFDMKNGTQLSLLTEQGFTSFAHLLGELVPEGHPAVPFHVRLLFRLLNLIAMGNRTWGVGEPNKEQEQDQDDKESGLTDKFISLCKWFHFRVIGGGLGWINGREPLQFGAVLATLNSPLTHCRLSRPISETTAEEEQQQQQRGEKDISVDKAYYFKPLCSDKPKLNKQDTRKLSLLAMEANRIGKQLRQWRRYNKTIKSDSQEKEREGESELSDEGNVHSNSFINAILLYLFDIFCDMVYWLLHQLNLMFPLAQTASYSSMKAQINQEKCMHETEQKNEANNSFVLRNRSSKKSEKVNEQEMLTRDKTEDNKISDILEGEVDKEDNDGGWQERDMTVLDAHVSTHTGTLWHSMGGCGCGSVLEGPKLTVKGTTNVHVIGAAAFPAPTRCNPMATCYTMGWRLGELLADGETSLSTHQ